MNLYPDREQAATYGKELVVGSAAFVVRYDAAAHQITLRGGPAEHGTVLIVQ